MRSLTSLVREADGGDALAMAVRALLDSGLIVFSRDSEGRLVQLSPQLAEDVGIEAEPGTIQPKNMKVFNEEGRLLAGAEYPDTVTRMSGKAQRGIRTQIVSGDGRSIWLQGSTMPLDRGSGGWSVLTLAADVTDLQTEIAELRARSTGQQGILRLATELCRRRVTFEEAAALLQEPLAALVPDVNVALGRQRGTEYESTMIHQAYGEPQPADSGRFQEAQRARWSAECVHVNQDVQDTDIYGASVVAEIRWKIRSLVVAPLVGMPEGRLAALWAHSESPNGFSEAQIEGLELVGRMLGAALVFDDEALAEAS